MKTLLLEIYRMSPMWLCVLCAAAALGFGLLERRMRRRSWWRRMLVGLLFGWAVAVLYATVLNRGGGAQGSFELVPLHSYREVIATGHREILRSSFMHVLLFFPAGLLGAALLPRIRGRALWLVLMAAVFSLTVEWLQFRFALGNAEADDVFHNALGALLGALGFGLRDVFVADP